MRKNKETNRQVTLQLEALLSKLQQKAYYIRKYITFCVLHTKNYNSYLNRSKVTTKRI